MTGYREFEIGRAYWAIPVLRGARRRIVIPIGRCGSSITWCQVSDFWTSDLTQDNGWGSECCRLQASDGDYTASAASPVPAEDAAMVLDVIRGRSS